MNQGVTSVLSALVMWSAFIVPGLAGELDAGELDDNVPTLLRKLCVDCHGKDVIQANLDIEKLSSTPDFANQFKSWERIAHVLETKRMPPADAAQPTDSERQELVRSIQGGLASHIRHYAGDPGESVLRRLTSAEYDYTIQDLTGLQLRLDRRFANDGVGGEGFTNVGTAQFIEDASLERYLEAAKTVADHAVIGAGPLSFFKDPGQTGRELSAIDRIQRIYRAHGFRTAAGEGGEPFGLDLYSRAFELAYRFKHRVELGRGQESLAELAREAGLSPRFCQHIWSVLDPPTSPEFPLSLIVESWRAIPPPRPHSQSPAGNLGPQVRNACDELGRTLREWQGMLASAAGDEEEAAVLDAAPMTVVRKHTFTADLNWPDGAKTAEFEISVSSASKQKSTGAFVIWRNPRLRFRRKDNQRLEEQPLKTFLSPESIAQLGFGQHPKDAAIGPLDFVVGGESTTRATLLLPNEMRAAQLLVNVELDLVHGAKRIVRCRIADGHVEGETAAEVGATSALLGDPTSDDFASWQSGVSELARLLPEVSHREPAPSDRDPIPFPFDNTYNKPERNFFHTAIKYQRDDRFLVEHILDDAARRQLDHAWTDLLTSFEYHETYLRFMDRKFNGGGVGNSVAEIARAIRPKVPEDAAERADHLLSEFEHQQQQLLRAEPGHVEDALQFAEQAWRRPLHASEQEQLRHYYARLRSEMELDHTKAIRSLLTRILVSPSFLYHTHPETSSTTRAVPPAEKIQAGDFALRHLGPWELANRLSYFLWSSLPDDELRRAAAAGELTNSTQLELQAKRMLKDPKARRLAAEFFGQWLGFYRFDEYRGIDARRFPEFNEKLKAALHDQAVSFFEFVIREDRPIDEILFGDYTFLNARSAEHYGLPASDLPAERSVRISDLGSHPRGGLFGLGAIHAITSAPLRTSAVKRGDWVLRRVMGRPVPPPPADAGSIAADDRLDDGLTVRQRLEAHRTDVACRNCHSRIDPLGFALEHFDPIGRWRETYRDGQKIDDSGILHDGTEVLGFRGLQEYLRREGPTFRANLAGKLLSYALGRSEIASDRPLVNEILAELNRTEKFSDLVARVVNSRQFAYRRR